MRERTQNAITATPGAIQSLAPSQLAGNHLPGKQQWVFGSGVSSSLVDWSADALRRHQITMSLPGTDSHSMEMDDSDDSSQWVREQSSGYAGWLLEDS